MVGEQTRPEAHLKPKSDKFIVRIETMYARTPLPPYTRSMFCLWDYSRLDAFKDVWFIPPSLRNCSDIPIGRNLAIERDLQMPWDAWLWIDDDHEFEPQVVHSLIEAMRRGAVDVISPLIGSKSEETPGRPMVFESYDEPLGLWNIMYTGWEKPDLYEVAGVGTGFELVSRKVFEKMDKPWYERTANPRRPDKLHGNDVNFCQKAKELGFRVWLDSRVEVGHTNLVTFYPRKDYVESGQQAQQLTEMRLKNPIEPSTREDVNSAEVWDKYYSHKGWEWRTRRQDVLRELRARIPDESTVLHFGCGDGWFTEKIEALGKGIVVHALEQSAAAISLARKRKVDCELVPRLAKFEANGTGKDKYDYILITDWMERLPDPEAILRKLIKRYGHKDTQLIVVTPARTLTPEQDPMHHHVFSEFNLGYLFDKFGRMLECEEFKEKILDPQGEPITEIPRYVTRSTLEKAFDGTVCLV